MRKIFHYWILLILSFPTSCLASDALAEFAKLSRAGLIVLNPNGTENRATNPDQPLIPASTTKLATALLALNHWGGQHRFSTAFYLDNTTQTLWVKGSGDPYLVSEELDRIARELKNKGLQHIHAIGLDTSLFEPGLRLPGTGKTNNPYDAVPTAVAANFNTVSIKKINGHIVSAESQTPVTPYAKTLGHSLRAGELRVNTGPNPHNAEIYFAELLAAFMRKHAISVGSQIFFGKLSELPSNRPVLFHTHINSKTLEEIVRAMLKYSTNFVANQLILMLSEETYRRSANAADVRRYMEETLGRHFAWENIYLEDGAGLSHNNRLSVRQLTQLLEKFRPWSHLLPEIEPGIYAKTGTLTGVSSLAGYLVKRNAWQPFAVVMNEPVPYRLRNLIAHELLIR